MKLISWNQNRLAEIVSLWNQEIGSHFPMREELFKQNSFDDKNVLKQGSSIAVNEDNKVIGFIVSKRWQEEINIQMNDKVGWIQVLLVDFAYRNQGVGSALLKSAEASLMEQGCQKIFLGRDPWHYFPGVPNEFENAKSWFEHCGYQAEGIESDLIHYYGNETKSMLPQLPDIQFSLLKEGEEAEFLSFMNKCFPGRWEYEAYKYFEQGGTGREFVVVRKAGQMIGFCRINDKHSPVIAPNVYWDPLFEESLGGIGPLGIDKSERKNGYGLAIVKAGISFLRERNINQIAIDWTGLVEFYGRMNYRVWKEYQQFSKEL